MLNELGRIIVCEWLSLPVISSHYKVGNLLFILSESDEGCWVWFQEGGT